MEVYGQYLQACIHRAYGQKNFFVSFKKNEQQHYKQVSKIIALD